MAPSACGRPWAAEPNFHFSYLYSALWVQQITCTTLTDHCIYLLQQWLCQSFCGDLVLLVIPKIFLFACSRSKTWPLNAQTCDCQCTYMGLFSRRDSQWNYAVSKKLSVILYSCSAFVKVQRRRTVPAKYLNTRKDMSCVCVVCTNLCFTEYTDQPDTLFYTRQSTFLMFSL